MLVVHKRGDVFGPRRRFPDILLTADGVCVYFVFKLSVYIN